MTVRLKALGALVYPPRLPRGNVARSLAVVGMGTALGQGALVIAAPILARLFDPLDFGILSVYAALLSVLVAVASLRFDFAIPIADDPIEALDLLVLSAGLAVASSVLVGIVVVLWGAPLAALFGAESLQPFLGLLPVALLIAGITQALAAWAVYHRKFTQLGRLRAVQGVGQAVLQVLFGILRAGPVGLIVGDLAGRALGTGQLFRSLLVDLRSTSMDRRRVFRRARERWGLARIMTVASLLSALSLQVPFILIPALFDLGSAGQYFLAYRVLFLPASLVAAAVSQVFFGEASLRRTDPTRLHDLARNVAVSLLVFSIPTYGIVTVCGSELFQVVFGPQWAPAGLYAQIIAPSLIVWCVASPISSLPLVGRRERESLAFTAGELVVRASALVIGAMLHSLTAGLILLSLMSVVLNVAALWRFLRVAAVSLGELVRPAARLALLTVPAMVLIFLTIGSLGSAGVLLMSVGAWAATFTLGMRGSPELRALISGSHD